MFIINPFAFGSSAASGSGLFTETSTMFLTVDSTFPWIGSLIRTAYYDAANNITCIGFIEVAGAIKNFWITGFNHGTGKWLGVYLIDTFSFANDTHGAIGLCQDADGYFYAFYGSHLTTQPWAISRSPNDISSWRVQDRLPGNVSYPFPVLVGSTIYLFNRDDSTLSRRTLQVRTATPSGGAATFSAKTVLVDFGASSRAYFGSFQADGTGIHFIGARATDTDSERKGVYYGVYETTTGAVRNIENDITIASGDLPVDLTEANADFRLVDHGTNDGDLPQMIRVGSTAHIIYLDDSASPYDLKYISHDGTTQSAATTLATITDHSGANSFKEMLGIVAGAGGSIEVWYPIDNVALTGNERGGDMRRRVLPSGGSWGTEEMIFEAATRPWAHPQALYGAHANLRVFFSEVANGEPDSNTTALQLVGYGDAGFITRPAVAPTDIVLSRSSISDDVPIGGLVAMLSAVDTDWRDTHTFTIVADTENKFTIVDNQLRLDAAVDAGVDTSHPVTIRATDSTTNTFDKALTIGVTVGNDDMIWQTINDTTWTAGTPSPALGNIAVPAGTTALRISGLEVLCTGGTSLAVQLSDDGGSTWNGLLSRTGTNFALKDVYGIPITYRNADVSANSTNINTVAVLEGVKSTAPKTVAAHAAANSSQSGLNLTRVNLGAIDTVRYRQATADSAPTVTSGRCVIEALVPA